MNRAGFVGVSSSSRTEPLNGRSPCDLSDDDLDTLRFELAKTEEEIQTLRQVLLAKEKYASDARRQLGLSPLSTMRQNLSRSWQDVQISGTYLTASATLDDISHSGVYVRTRDNLSHAGQVTSAALSNVGVAFTRRLAEMRALPLPGPPRSLSHTVSVPTMRHSSTFKSLEEMVDGLKDKVTNNGDAFQRRSARHNAS